MVLDPLADFEARYTIVTPPVTHETTRWKALEGIRSRHCFLFLPGSPGVWHWRYPCFSCSDCQSLDFLGCKDFTKGEWKLHEFEEDPAKVAKIQAKAKKEEKARVAAAKKVAEAKAKKATKAKKKKEAEDKRLAKKIAKEKKKKEAEEKRLARKRKASQSKKHKKKKQKK